MNVNPWRAYRPATFSGKEYAPPAYYNGRTEPFWKKRRRKLTVRKDAQKINRLHGIR